MKYSKDIIEVENIFGRLDIEKFHSLPVHKLRRLFNQLKTLDKTARGPLWDLVINQIMVKEMFDMIPESDTERTKLEKAKLELRIFIDDALKDFSLKELSKI